MIEAAERLITYYNSCQNPLPPRRIGEVHRHTTGSDGYLRFEEVVERALEGGVITDLYITDHNAVGPSMKAVEYANKHDYHKHGFRVRPGSEITARENGKKMHILALGVTEDIDRELPLEDTIREIQRQKGLVIIPHASLERVSSVPLTIVWDLMNKGISLDGIEIKNGSGDAVQRIPGIGPLVFGRPNSNDVVTAFYERHKGHPHIGAAIGGSDGHGTDVGRVLTGVWTDDFEEGIKSRQTVVLYDGEIDKRIYREAFFLALGTAKIKSGMLVKRGRSIIRG